jgi:hypothetical protein
MSAWTILVIVLGVACVIGGMTFWIWYSRGRRSLSLRFVEYVFGWFKSRKRKGA